MSDRLESAIGEGLIALGLYAACFESMVLAFRAKTREYLTNHEPESLPTFFAACVSADRTFRFVGPRLVQFGALAQQDYDALTAIRRRRNELAHEGYNHVFTLRVDDLDADLSQINRATVSVDSWHVPPGPHTKPEVRASGERIPFRISPALITNLVREVAGQLVHSLIRSESVGEDEPSSPAV